jgi:hypothetical protein
MTDVVAAWFALLFGLTGMGAVLSFVVRFLHSARGGLR